uniref:Uncharacterized protein n=1 Tax=Arundo donax TaxID=35708 RepID=A0A0A9SDV6_ARUDO
MWWFAFGTNYCWEFHVRQKNMVRVEECPENIRKKNSAFGYFRNEEC